MRNTPPRSAIEERETHELVEDLCIALRNVGGNDYGLPDDERGVAFIREVQQLAHELSARGTDTSERVGQLSRETGWQMESLLRECLAFPSLIPYVREADNVRRTFRCPICSQREYPDREGIQLCDECLEGGRTAIRTKTPTDGLILFRTYSESKRCPHAEGETVLVTLDDEYDFHMADSYCDQCLAAEQRRRQR